MKYYFAFAALCRLAFADGDESSSSSSNATRPSTSTAPQSSASSELAGVMLDELNNHLARDYLIALAGVVIVLFAYRAAVYTFTHIRRMACLNNNTQRYFAIPHDEWTLFKKHFLYAPLLKNRHNRELRLSSAVNMGMLPTRFQSIFLFAILVANVTLCVYGLPWSSPEAKILPTLCNRTGTIAIANLVPIIVLSSPKNPLIKWLNVSFDSMNIIHRGLARLAVVEAVVHMLCWSIATVEESGWSAIGKALDHSTLIMTGFVAVLALIVIAIQSMSALRHAFYEVFHHLHVALIIVLLAFLYAHLDGYPQQMYLVGAIVTWGIMRFLRLVSFLIYNIGRGGTKATIEVLPGDALRLSITTPRKVENRPGSHIYLTIPAAGLWTAHPFSIAWNDIELPNLHRMDSSSSTSSYGEKKLPRPVEPELEACGKQTLSAVIRRRTGFTNSLYRKAEAAGAVEGAKVNMNCYVEAGYGLPQSMIYSCGTVMLFAGGIGITHQIPYVRYLVEGHAAGTVAAKKVVLVWVTQSPEHLEWIRPWMTRILAMEKRREVLTIKLFITRPRSAKEVSSPSATVQMYVQDSPLFMRLLLINNPGSPAVQTSRH